MKRIDTSTVELTVYEEAASRLFESLLDRGLGIYDAMFDTRLMFPHLSQEFVDYKTS